MRRRRDARERRPLIAANATGCLEVFSTPYPESSWQLPWLHSLFGNAPAVATGIAAALKAKGRTDVRVLGQGGDGGTVDIGFACLSGMFERNDDVLYVCYDNEGYMNTGVQRSGATPPAARTATTEAVGDEPGQRLRPGQERAADRARARDPVRGDGDDRRPARPRGQGRAAMGMRGARYLHVLVTCPLGWGTARVRLASGIARLADAVRAVPGLRGRARRRDRGRRRSAATSPVEDYLRPQRRFRHLFEPERARRRASPASRPAPTATSTASDCCLMDKPFAITLDVGSSLANKTGTWRTERPVYVRNAAPCAGACPAGEDPQAWLYHAEEGDYETAWRAIMDVNPLPAIMGRVCYHPCETACNRAQLDEAVGINSVERFLGDEAIRHGWTRRRRPRRRPASACSSSAPGPSGLSAAYHLARLGHTVEIHDAGPRAGGMMRFGIPRYRLPRDVLDAEVQRILDLGVTLQLDRQRRRPRRRDARRRLRRRLRRRRRPPRQARLHPGRQRRADARRRRAAARHGGRGARRCSAAASPSTAAATPRFDAARTAKRLGAEEAVVVYRRTRDRMPAHDSELEEALAEGVTVKWLSTIRHADGGRLTARADGARRRRLPAADRRARGARGRLARARARPGVRPRRCSSAPRASRSTTASCASART